MDSGLKPHRFVGRSDRWCEVCDRPDRDPIHERPPQMDISRLESVSISAGRLSVTPLVADADRIAALEAENARLVVANRHNTDIANQALASLREAEEKSAALAAALDGSRNCPECHGFGYIDTGGPHYETDSAEERALTDMWRRRKCDCRTVDPAAILAAVREKARREGGVEVLKELDHLCEPALGINERAEVGLQVRTVERAEIRRRIAALEGKG